MKSSRRSFLITSIGVATTVALSKQAFAADATKVSESDAMAVTLGYKLDATKVDKAKFAKYVAGEKCDNCALFQGKATDAFAPCPMFGGKQVSGKGWCNGYNKKA